MRNLITCLSVCVLSAATFAETRTVINEDFKLLASDWASGDLFGRSVAISGDTVVVGASKDDDNGDYSGSAYTYKFDGSSWIEYKLTASDGQEHDYFAESVAVSGNMAIVGASDARNKGFQTGSAYIYEFDGILWTEVTKLLASDGATYDDFGWSVSISSDSATAIVGAYGDDGSSGSAYIYKFDGNNWIETKLTASDGANGDRFGYSVSISGDTVVVGADNDDDNGDASGSAYVYRFDGNNWIETKLTASDGASSDRFGTSVAISGDTVVVGAYYDDDNGSNSGSAYIYRFDGNNWIETDKLLASDGANNDFFGWRVAVDGDTVVVGAHYDDDNGDASGSAYVYRFDGKNWIETKLLASDGASDDRFGESVAISGDTVVVGAHYDDDTGSAYVFYIAEPVDTDGDGVPDDMDNCYLYNPDQADCNENGIGDVCDVADQTSFDCDQNGEPDECQPDCDGDGFIDACDNEGDCDDDGIPDNCEADCNGNSIPDDCDIIYGISQDCNGNGIPDECDIADGTANDCNGNGVPDSCDIADEPAFDCDSDGLIDSCAINDGLVEDCNGNNIPDECDILDGTEQDCNGNGVPDNCEVNGETKLLASDGASDDYFGASVAISGDTIVVGAPNDNDSSDSGSAYVYRFDGNNWIETKLTASDGASSDRFGYRVATSGDTVVVGAHRNDDNGTDSGSAYVYRFDGNNWIETKLLPSDGASGDRFGLGVATSGDTVVVGAYYDDDNGFDSGSAYVYRFDGNNWIETKLTASDGASSDWFGWSVATSGDTVVVGAYGPADNGSSSGSAYIYSLVKGLWQETKLLASDGASGDYFGLSVAISGDTVVVGASYDDDNGTDSGSAYVYRFDGNNWIETKLLPSDGASGDRFGLGVATSGDTVVVGSCYDDDNGSQSGSAYVYRFDGNNWIEAKLTASDGASGDLFGYSVATSGDTVVVGSCYDDDNDSSSGSAYVCSSPFIYAEDCNTNGVPDECDIDDGTSYDVNGNGIPDECEVDCNGNGVPDHWDIKTGTSEDCNGNGVPDSCDTADEPAFDCDSDGLIDSCAINDGLVEDCNTNGVPDECDIDDGTSTDWNGNSIPDECEVDCNSNGYPDDYDIKMGWSEDVNGDGIPDECQCIADITGDFLIDVNDLLAIIGYWGSDGPLGDVNQDGIVDVSDLLIVVANWGLCNYEGACCLPNGGCAEGGFYICNAIGGQFQGPGTLCEDITCP